MKVKTLLATLAYTVDEVELYTRNWYLITRTDQDALRAEYADMTVAKFWIYSYTDCTTLEIVVR